MVKSTLKIAGVQIRTIAIAVLTGKGSADGEKPRHIPVLCSAH